MATSKKVPATKPAPKTKLPRPDAIPTHPPEVPEDGPMPKADLPDDDLPTTPPEVPEAGESPAPPPPKEKAKTPAEQVDKEKLLSFLESIIDTLTFKRVGLIALLALIGIGLWTLYENRVGIVDSIVHTDGGTPVAPAPTNWELSEPSKLSLQNLAKTTAVSFIAVSDVDLQKNRRTVRYYFVDDPAVKLTPDALRALALPQAVFDYDAKNTQQMVSILSNEFRCDPYRDTIYFRYAPELEVQVPLVCRLAVPPFVGSFVGFITIGVSADISPQERDTIRLEVSRIAVDIYLKDVIKKPAVE